MGIVNTSTDSFHRPPLPDSAFLHLKLSSSTGEGDALAAALDHARRLVAEGADLLDIGGQSTRPGYTEITDAEEIARTAPLLRALAQEFPRLPLSIDTYKPAVAAAALEAGAHIVNDIHGLQGPGGPALARLAAESGATLIVMHNDEALRDASPCSEATVRSYVLDFLRRSLDIAASAGVPADRIVLDPGIGFAKTQPQNVALLRNLHALHELGRPILLGVSRKSVFGYLLPRLATPDDRLEATLAATALAVRQGVQLHRVHDVLPARRAALIASALA
jgi:dihydropteroate synthase